MALFFADEHCVMGVEMNLLWNGEKVSLIYRVLAGMLSLATIIIIPLIALNVKEDFNMLDTTLGIVCYLYLILVFASVAIRGKAPTGVIPWK